MIKIGTRVLSLVSALLMAVWMLTCFAIPAIADDALVMYQAMAADAQSDPNGLGAALDAGETNVSILKGKACGMTFKADAKPRTSWYTAYTDAGYTGTSWSISAPEDWTFLISDVGYNKIAQGNNYLYVTNDINFGGIEMSRPQMFRCYLYGQNHSFLDVNIVVSAGGGENLGAALVGRSCNDDPNGFVVGMENLAVTGEIRYTCTSDKAWCGTFVANHQDGAFSLKTCKSSVTINATLSGAAATSPAVGGMVGRINTGTIENCEFNGSVNVTTTDAKPVHVGGILGRADGSGATIRNCSNKGNVTVNGKDMTSYMVVGGIVGELSVASTVIGCLNTGNVTVNGKRESGVGGIVGYAASSKILRCRNDGTIYAERTSSRRSAAGIAGFCAGNGIIDGCLNNGDVSVGANNYSVANGIVGYQSRTTKVYNSISAGAVQTHYASSGGAAVRSIASDLTYTSATHGMPYLENGIVKFPNNGAPVAWSRQPMFNTYNTKGYVWEGEGVHPSSDEPAAVNALFAVSSDGEAGWRANNNYVDTNAAVVSRTYYTIEGGKLAFGTSENRVRRILVDGGAAGVFYAAGKDVISVVEDLNLQPSGSNRSYTVTNANTGEAIPFENDTFIVPAADVNIAIGSAPVCMHNEGDYIPATATTHIYACKDCSFENVEECTFVHTHNSEVSYDKETAVLTAKYRGLCDCSNTIEGDCTYDEIPATCSDGRTFDFTCDRADYIAEDSKLGHDFSGAEWKVDGEKEYQECKRSGCGGKNYRLIGIISAKSIEMRANKDNGAIIIALPELTEGKIKLTLFGEGYEILNVIGAAATAEANVYGYEGTEMVVTIKSAKTVVANGALKVEVIEAKNGEMEVSNAVAMAIIVFVALDGDANADDTLTLSDALVTLYYVVGDAAYKAAHPINLYNANLYYDDGNRKDGFININDAYAVVKVWLKVTQF